MTDWICGLCYTRQGIDDVCSKCGVTFNESVAYTYPDNPPEMTNHETRITDGQKIPVTGYYGYGGHVDGLEHDCFVPIQSNGMMFKKGEEAPKLGSCEHEITWVLKEAYK